jgi:NAD(P)-dependent dehydrogenase (short-subunit alcohol dehydrogenase family)
MHANQSGSTASATLKESKIALVTGANQGVGFQIARALSENGYIVYVGSRNIQNGETAAGKIGGATRAIQLDVTQPASFNAAVNKIQAESGRLDLLVNNAAISHAGKPGRTLEEIMEANKASVASIDEMRTVWETNVFGLLAVTQACLPLLRMSQAARIVNVSSSLGSLTLNADPSWPYYGMFEVVYGASKTALNAITLALANELKSMNIKVNAVSPGFTATALNNFQGTDTVEEGSREPIRVALEEDGPTGGFTGPGSIVPW